jgi:UDP-N-acetylmuramate--alanine ligase
MGTYGGDFALLKAAFVEFFRRLPFYGVAVVCLDDREAASLIPDIRARVITYGTTAEADIRGFDLQHVDGREHFRVACKGRAETLAFELNLPGEHNVLNALAAIAVGLELGLPVPAIAAALGGFQGIGRRCQIHHDIPIGGRALILVDDYGHHPNEIEAVLNTIRRRWPGRRVVVVFQPHRYSRTRDLFEDFARVLSRADVLLLLDVYSAGESPIAGADGRSLCRAIRARGLIEPIFVDDLDAVAEVLAGAVLDGDIVAMLGAGNIGAMAEALTGGEGGAGGG